MEIRKVRVTSPAWYYGSREEFLSTPGELIANQLSGRAADESLDIEPSQTEEWRQSVDILQTTLEERIPILRAALLAPGCEAIRDVILEFDFHRRGLRMDCILLAEGVLFVIEFKRSKLQRADRDQVMSYAVNLLEFHRLTQEWCNETHAIVVPILTTTSLAAASDDSITWPGLAARSWPSLANRAIECNRHNLKEAIRLGLEHRRSDASVNRSNWLNSTFRPSSSILDAALSLYGNHDVAAIEDHAAPKAAIEASTKEIEARIEAALQSSEYHIIFLSGSPGAGKTLVGLELTMRGRHADGAVFVTGNAPLVDVLNKALESSYRSQSHRGSSWTLTGYHRSDAHLVASAANFKIVKAHNFLGKRGTAHRQEDGRVLVFDEAQRTYEKGRVVLGQALSDHEADLILKTQKDAYPKGGAVIVALIGHNQAINRGERGLIAWLEAATRHGWIFSIGNETLALAKMDTNGGWSAHPNRRELAHGHLHQSMRYYRNDTMESWVSALLEGPATTAARLAQKMELHQNTVWICRDLEKSKRWIKDRTIGGQRAGLIASSQARRLAAEGLFVDYKPDIATWMLAPTGDIRSSNALETVQNQYQIQGLELDYTIVCWDADLRRDNNLWLAYKLRSGNWQHDNLIDVAKNSYRVLLTRARKGMVIFVPNGDHTNEDTTRSVEFYDEIHRYLIACGARNLE